VAKEEKARNPNKPKESITLIEIIGVDGDDGEKARSELEAEYKKFEKANKWGDRN
jgi:hypothetical protein